MTNYNFTHHALEEFFGLTHMIGRQIYRSGMQRSAQKETFWASHGLTDSDLNDCCEMRIKPIIKNGLAAGLAALPGGDIHSDDQEQAERLPGLVFVSQSDHCQSWLLP